MGNVTAVVSAYKTRPGWTRGRIENLLDQDPSPKIVVVCQAGSQEALEAAQTLSPQVITITTEGIPTVYSAWNIGIREARTPYITNANADDRLYPGALAALTQVLDDNQDIAVAYSYVNKVLEIDGDPIGSFTWAGGGLAQLLRGDFLGPMPVWRRSLHDRYGFFPEHYESAGDYEYWLRLAYHGERFKLLSQALGAYLYRPDSIEHRDRLTTEWETAKARSRWSLKKWWDKYDGIHQGQRVYILGNGPSLKDTPIELLNGCPVIGSNRIYRRYDPTYLVAVNPLVLEQYWDEIDARPSIKFRAGYEIDTTYNRKVFNPPFVNMWEGYTVTYVALQIAYFMGAKEVILLGLDHDYGQLEGEPNEEQTLEGPDRGHFDPDYFSGARWNLPDLEGSEQAYQIARQWYEADGRRIINASAYSACTVFERGQMEDYI